MKNKSRTTSRWAQTTILFILMISVIAACTQTEISPSPDPTRYSDTFQGIGISYTVQNSDGCQSFQFVQDQEAAYGRCGETAQAVPFVEAIRTDELNHYIATFQSFQMQTATESIIFNGEGDIQPSVDEQRSILAWVQLIANEILSGRSSAAEGLIIGWHREGGLDGTCDDLSIYETGDVVATSCKHGQAQALGQTWLDAEQLSGLYQWMDTLGRFEYAPQTTATTDSLKINLVFAGNGSTTASNNDQQAIAVFTERAFAQFNGSISVNLDGAKTVVEKFLTNLKTDPSGKSSVQFLSKGLQADIQSGSSLPILLGIQNVYASFDIVSSQPGIEPDSILVDVLLYFDSPIHCSLMLIKGDDGNWLIDSISKANRD